MGKKSKMNINNRRLEIIREIAQQRKLQRKPAVDMWDTEEPETEEDVLPTPPIGEFERADLDDNE